MDRVGVGEHAVPREPSPLLVLSQVGFRLGGGFFDRTRVVVLMPGQGRATREGLLAIRIRALVRTLARVDPAVSRQGRRIAEGLDGLVRGTSCEERVSTYFATSLTHVRFFARMDTRVYRQGGALDELLPTTWPITGMRSDAGVDSF